MACHSSLTLLGVAPSCAWGIRIASDLANQNEKPLISRSLLWFRKEMWTQNMAIIWVNNYPTQLEWSLLHCKPAPVQTWRISKNTTITYCCWVPCISSGWMFLFRSAYEFRLLLADSLALRLHRSWWCQSRSRWHLCGAGVLWHWWNMSHSERCRVRGEVIQIHLLSRGWRRVEYDHIIYKIFYKDVLYDNDK